jgi:S1-C subfamily serine protease
MSSPGSKELGGYRQPRPGDYNYDLDQTLTAVLGLRASVPKDAVTAGSLGTERAGNGVSIGPNGLVLTIGYLIAEAESIWLSTAGGQAVQGHAMAYDYESGFGLVQALGRLDVPALSLGDSTDAAVGTPVVIAGAGGRNGSIAAKVTARREFAGYWEYVVDDAIFTAPAHPNWGGTALIGPAGTLLGIGSLQLQESGDAGALNMHVPVNLLKPILEDLLTLGRRRTPPAPWLGLYAREVDDKVVIAGLADGGPARRANVRAGDIVIAVGDEQVGDLIGLFRGIRRRGDAGVEIPLVVYRNGHLLELRVRSADRAQSFKSPRLH